MKHVVLASGSPRRKALLEALGLELEIITSGADEIFVGEPSGIVKHNAMLKLDDVLVRLTCDALVIAADTLVFCDEHVMGKPSSLDEARVMVRRLSGATHHVLTGVAVADTATGKKVSGYEDTAVTFRELTDVEINEFVTAVNPLDRAGAYTIEGPGSLLVSRYDGCYQNVLGLPIVRLDGLCRELGYSLFDLMDGAKASFL